MINNDRLVTVDALNAVGPFNWSNGIKLDSLGRVVVTTINPTTTYLNGLPRDAAGNLCVSAA